MLFNQLNATKARFNSKLENVEADDERVEDALMTSEVTVMKSMCEHRSIKGVLCGIGNVFVKM